jgi:hypothetical protein
VGAHTVEWVALGDGGETVATQSVLVGAAIHSLERASLSDRARISTTTGLSGLLHNSGSGELRVGNDAGVGSLTSVGPIFLGHRSTATGDLSSADAVTVETTAVVLGDLSAHGQVFAVGAPALPSFPPASGLPLTVDSGQTLTLPPGSYPALTLNSQASLTLGAGDYFFGSFVANSGATMTVDAQTRVFVASELALRSSFKDQSGAIARILLGFAGAQAVLEAPFDGAVLAPNAVLSFGTGSGLTFTGSFIARVLDVRPNSELVCSAELAGAPSEGGGTPEPDPGLIELEATLTVNSDWGSGYCASLSVHNPSSTPVGDWWVELDTQGTAINNVWNGNVSAPSGSIELTPGSSWNQAISPLGTDSSIGFCGGRPAGNGNTPAILAATGTP